MTDEAGKISGLSAAEVEAARAAGKNNIDATVKTRSVGEILRSNIFTLFNIVNVILFCFVLYTGSYQNGLFMIIIVLNAAIGIIQEIRSKRVTDRLSIVAARDVKVIRDGERTEVPLDEVVLGDCIVLGRGDQIPCDAVVVAGSAKVDESLLTGESTLIAKTPLEGLDIPRTVAEAEAIDFENVDPEHVLMSGSFVNAGNVTACVRHVGADNYASKISSEAKQRSKVNSEIMHSVNTIIKYVSIIIFPVGALLFASEHFLSGIETNSAILSTVAALVGMVPEGLILLTSTVLALAVIRLSQKNVLVQQLYCIETLAHVDTLCLDKTGTITSGAMEVVGFELIDGAGDSATMEIEEARSVLHAIAAADPDPNDTALAICAWAERGGTFPEEFAVDDDEAIEEPDTSVAALGRAIAETGREKMGNGEQTASGKITSNGAGIEAPAVASYVPFSSDRKWSGATLADGRSFVMGAAEFVLDEAHYASVKDRLAELAGEARVLVLAQVDGFNGDAFTGVAQPLGFVSLFDQIRSSATRTIAFFEEEGVDVKVISGDDPRTVSTIAERVGIKGAEDYVDATTLETDEQIAEAITNHHVFGRVKPEQKKAFVKALQEAGHTVAMTGDGVNDTLALKAADCSVAMAAGSDAARNVSELVLVDNDFAHMPEVVAEGRQSINNLQRSASLFLVKTGFSIIMAVLFVLLPWQYPYQPIQMTLISACTIGIPSFVLALEPNHDRIKGHFFENVIVRSLPGSITVVITVLVVNIVGYLSLGLTYAQVSSVCVMLTAWVGVNLIIRISRPFTPLRVALIIFVSVLCVLGAVLLPDLFSISGFTFDMWVLAIVMGAVAAIGFNWLYNKFDRRHAARQAEYV